MRAFLGLGSNLGDRHRYLQDAVDGLADLVAVSRLYESAPVGGPEQGAYLNIVVQLDTRQLPHELLETCHRLERAAGRERVVRWGPRTLDVDILWIDGVRVDSPELTIPHPRMHERNFVMDPLFDLDPGFEHPRYNADEAYGNVTAIGTLISLPRA